MLVYDFDFLLQARNIVITFLASATKLEQ